MKGENEVKYPKSVKSGDARKTKSERSRRPDADKKNALRSSEFRNSRYKLPKDTASIIKPEDIDNFALRLNKAPFFDADDGKFKFFKMNKNLIVLDVKPDFSKLKIKAIAERHKTSINKQNLKIESAKFRPVWRMVVGLGSESIYETSMTFHHIYGIPYIPGSAIKGVIRSYIITEEFGKDNNGDLDLRNAEEKALKNKVFCDIFGCSKNSFYNKSMQGRIVFFDAVPSSLPKIKPDVMNPHYGPYYSDSSGKTPPADYHNPVPIFFLTVEDTEFEFIIGVKEIDNTPIQEGKFRGKTLLSVAFEWMEKALKEHGIGAKTAVGYGNLTREQELEQTDRLTSVTESVR